VQQQRDEHKGGRVSNQRNIVGFTVGPETFGVAIEVVHEIVRMADVTRLPETPDYIEGVINLRGRVVPVIDLRKRFGERQIAGNKRNRIVFADLAGHTTGLIVDSASEVLKIPSCDIEPAPDVFEEGEAHYVTGIAKLRDRLMIMVDLNKLMNSGELKQMSELRLRQSKAEE
jgi:purine-binding chemotaxis protein CheW